MVCEIVDPTRLNLPMTFRRLWTIGILTSAMLVVAAAPAAAHGIGGRSDLPIDLTFFLVGAGLVLVFTFVLLSVMWPTERFSDGPLDRPIRAPWARPAFAFLKGLGLASLVLAIAAGLFGRDTGARSIVPVLVWVGVWLLVPFLGVFVGNLWSAMNPWRTISSLLGFDKDERPELIAQVGVYPATIAFLAFTWFELVYWDTSSPRTLATAAVAYSFFVLGVASWAGTTTGMQIGEFFTVYNRFISAIGPFGRDADGALVWRGWLRGLVVLPKWRGMVLFVSATIGTVTYDGLSGTPWFNERLATLGLTRSAWVGTASLLLSVAVIFGAFLAASWAAGRLAGSDLSAMDIAAEFTHTLHPIGFAYAFAHYLTLILFEGQLLWIQASDPFGFGWDLFGTASWRTQFWLSTTATWWIQVFAITGGHVLGVVLAHDRAIRLFGKMAVRSQYAMLVLMVLLTGLGLAILAAG